MPNCVNGHGLRTGAAFCGVSARQMCAQGHLNEPGSRFCQTCGSPLGAAQDPFAQAPTTAAQTSSPARFSPPADIATPLWSAPPSRPTTLSANGASVSCPSDGYCVAVDQSGSAFVYQQGSWSPETKIDGNNSFGAISCGRPNACVATDQHDNVLYYTSPNSSAT